MFIGRFTLGRKERCWYRLHSSRLYTLELGRAARGDGPVCVFDLRKGAVVAPRPGDASDLSMLPLIFLGNMITLVLRWLHDLTMSPLTLLW